MAQGDQLVTQAAPLEVERRPPPLHRPQRPVDQTLGGGIELFNIASVPVTTTATGAARSPIPGRRLATPDGRHRGEPVARRPARRVGGTRSDSWRVLDRLERPVTFQPSADRVVKHWVEFGTVRAHPGTDGRIMFTRAGAVLAFAARRVDVDAADDFAGAGAEHGVGEPAALGEVLRVAFEVAEVFRQAHLMWPARPGESRRRLDVADAGRPCRIVRSIVLGPERFQPEFSRREPTRDREIHRNEELITHQAMLAGQPSHHPAQRQHTPRDGGPMERCRLGNPELADGGGHLRHVITASGRVRASPSEWQVL
jgi:hypothetical protein